MLAKSLGVRTFFWVMEKKIPGLVQPGGVDRGVDHDGVRPGVTQPLDGGLAAVV